MSDLKWHVDSQEAVNPQWADLLHKWPCGKLEGKVYLNIYIYIVYVSIHQYWSVSKLSRYYVCVGTHTAWVTLREVEYVEGKAFIFKHIYYIYKMYSIYIYVCIHQYWSVTKVSGYYVCVRTHTPWITQKEVEYVEGKALVFNHIYIHIIYVMYICMHTPILKC